MCPRARRLRFFLPFRLAHLRWGRLRTSWGRRCTDRIPHRTRLDRHGNRRRRKPMRVLRNRLCALLLPPPSSSRLVLKSHHHLESPRSPWQPSSHHPNLRSQRIRPGCPSIRSPNPEAPCSEQFRLSGFHALPRLRRKLSGPHTQALCKQVFPLFDKHATGPSPTPSHPPPLPLPPRIHTHRGHARALPQRVPPSQTDLLSFHKAQRPPAHLYPPVPSSRLQQRRRQRCWERSSRR